MENARTLHARRSEMHRAAMHVINEKGAQKWSGHDQTIYEALLSGMEQIDDALLGQQAAKTDSIFAKYLAQHRDVENYIRTGVRNTMSTTTGSQGGLTVRTLVANKIMSQLKGRASMRAVCSEMTLASGAALNYPTSDGTSEAGERLAQNALASSLDPTFGAADLTAWKYGSKLFTVPIELLQDSSVDIVDFVAQRSMERIASVQNADFTTGTGSSQPTGIVTAAAIGKTGLTGQTTTIIFGDLVDMIESVDAGALGMPTKDSGAASPAGTGFMMSQAMRKVVRKIVDSNGRPVWLPASHESTPMLLDYPAYINNDMPVPAANAKSLLFGNYTKYMVRDVPEVELFRFDDSAFATKGQVGFLAIARAGGNLLDAGAVKAYANSAT